MPRGTRTRLETGIFADASGLCAIVKVGAIQKEKRYPADTDRAILKRWQATTRETLISEQQGQRQQRQDPRGLARSIASYLKRRQGRAGYRADRSHLKAWLARLGNIRRHLVTNEQVEHAITLWRSAGKSETTIRHRLRVLRELYQALDGDGITYPGKGVVLPKTLRPAPIPVSRAVIQTVADSLKTGLRHAKGYGSDPTLSRAYFLVYATTGQRPAQIGRAKPGDVDLERRIWFVRTAKGGNPIPLPLNDDMVAAWTVFIAANAWGAFDPTSLAKVLRRHGWPVGIRPYQLRHTFAIDLLLSGADLGDVQGLLGHQSIQTTRQFYAPILLARLTSTVAGRRLNLDASTTVPANRVPAEKRLAPQNAVENRTSAEGARTPPRMRRSSK